MKIELSVKKVFDIKTLHVNAGVRYWEDATVNGVEDALGDLIPCREGDRWKPIIDIENGKIINWSQGVKSEIHYKICDDGIYSIHNEEGESILTVDGYVISSLSPNGNGYGDYIKMTIDENGKIDKWKFIVDDFTESED
jgi:hypothetical protein